MYKKKGSGNIYNLLKQITMKQNHNNHQYGLVFIILPRTLKGFSFLLVILYYLLKAGFNGNGPLSFFISVDFIEY
ncbi:MAG: hypothetical protein ACI9SD_001930, partial [Pseudohongiellaceae bacterium]